MRVVLIKQESEKIMNGDLHCLVPNSVALDPANEGLLSNKSFVAKDLFRVAGHVSSFGNAGWRETHGPSKTTAPVISTLLESGARMVGITKMDQLGYSLIGNVGEGEAPINSLYPERFTGGSSSGSASAVAGGLADFGLGTDTVGSIRVPAASCGLYSMRPTYEKLSVDGVLPWARSFDCVSVLARDAGLLQTVFSVLSKSRSSKISFKKVLIPSNCAELTSSETVDVIQEVSRKIAQLLSTEVEQIDFSMFTSTVIADLFTRLQGREIWKQHGEWVLQNKQHLDADVASRFVMAEQFANSSEEEKRKDDQARAKYVDDFRKLITGDVILILPVMPDLAPQRTATLDELITYRKALLRLNICASLMGVPEAVLPAKHTSSGSTYGVGIMSARNTDNQILELIKRLF